MADTDPKSNIHAIVLAAGDSRRMGVPKQTLPYRGTTITGYIVRTLLAAPISTVVVVTRSALRADLDLPDDARIGIVVNDAVGSEMIESVRLGLAQCVQSAHVASDGVLVIPGDMPHVSSDTVRQCLAAFQANPGRLIVATCEGRRGHPLIFPARLRVEVAGLAGGLNTLLDVHRGETVQVETNDPGVLENINTPDDYERLA